MLEWLPVTFWYCGDVVSRAACCSREDTDDDTVDDDVGNDVPAPR